MRIGPIHLAAGGLGGGGLGTGIEGPTRIHDGGIPFSIWRQNVGWWRFFSLSDDMTMGFTFLFTMNIIRYCLYSKSIIESSSGKLKFKSNLGKSGVFFGLSNDHVNNNKDTFPFV